MNYLLKTFTGLSFSLALMLFAYTPVHAQSYFNSLGVRLANGTEYRTAGISYQQRLLRDFTLEGIAQTDFSQNTTFHALMEYHRPIVSKRLNYYVGAGLMSGKENSYHKSESASYQSTIFGADLVAGIELTLLKFTISFDYKPNFNLVGREKWFQDQVGISVRAVLINGNKRQKRLKAKQKAKAKEIRDTRYRERMSNSLIKTK